MLTKARLSDLNEIDKLALLVIEDMKQSRIPQWDSTYPRHQHYRKDIIQNACVLYKENNIILGVMSLMPENDPPYKTIQAWLREKSIVLHRILVHPLHQNKGIAKTMIDYAVEFGKKHHYESIKIDTHLDNYKMKRFLLKQGFKPLVYIEAMDRFAYELILEDDNE